MVSKATLLEVLPFRDQVVLKEERQDTSDIRAEILAAHRDYAPDYDLIYHYFNTGNIVDTSREIFDFLKQNVPYTKENGRYQTVKSPAVILMDNSGSNNYDRIDCKNYACFIAGVIDGIKRNDGGAWDWCFRFASYDQLEKEPGHVFVVVKIEGKELWIDPVFTYFNAGSMHEWELDEKPSIGGLYRISGPDNGIKQSVVVNTKDAAVNFVICVQHNLFGLPQLLLNYPAITNGPVRKALVDSGVDINALNAVLNYVKKQGLL